MPIRFVIDGQQHEVDTPDEAVDLRQALSSSNGHGARGSKQNGLHNSRTATPESTTDFKGKRLREAVFLSEDAPFVSARYRIRKA